jgi:hypothetical protein
VSPARYELSFYFSEDGILHSHHYGNLKSYAPHPVNCCAFRYEVWPSGRDKATTYIEAVTVCDRAWFAKDRTVLAMKILKAERALQLNTFRI